MKVLVAVKRVVDYNVKIRVKADGTSLMPFESPLHLKTIAVVRRYKIGANE